MKQAPIYKFALFNEGPDIIDSNNIVVATMSNNFDAKTTEQHKRLFTTANVMYLFYRELMRHPDPIVSGTAKTFVKFIEGDWIEEAK